MIRVRAVAVDRVKIMTARKINLLLFDDCERNTSLLFRSEPSKTACKINRDYFVNCIGRSINNIINESAAFSFAT